MGDVRNAIDEIDTVFWEKAWWPNGMNVSEEEWVGMLRFWEDYWYVYLFQNQTVVNISNQGLYKYFMFLFEGRANELLGNTNSKLLLITVCREHILPEV